MGTTRIWVYDGIGKLGYRTSSDEFIEDGIPHMRM
ncbi:GNAT family N-acetyltransferase [Paenibacillus antibioticophila]|nr:GNAT family N-acetyltransferase [Paenibacillus antibioticophila]